MSGHPCDGCGSDGATEVLYLVAPLGLCVVRVHRDRACAQSARAGRGGGRFVKDETGPPPEPRPEDERLMRVAREYAADWRRSHAT